MMRRLIFVLLVFVPAACNLSEQSTSEINSTGTSDGTRLVVAWVENGNLLLWQSGDTLTRRISSGGVIQPFIAPDGEHIAFTRGANAAPETLWVIDTAGTAEQQLVGERPRSYRPGIHQIGDVVWLDESILYFNTLVQQATFFLPRNDLYRSNIRTREVALILPATEGGRIYPSPNGEHIVTVSSGNYGRQNGLISVVDPLALEPPDNLLFFVGVSTASERAFYPVVHWLPDSSAVLVAIPDTDLIYSETEEIKDVPFTRLWRLPIENPSERELMGSLRLSFFGLPRWSKDGSALTFLRRSPQSNNFTAYLADGRGENEQALYSGAAETLEQARWIPNSNRYTFVRANPNGTLTYFIGGVGDDILRLSDEAILRLRFINEDTYVYAAINNGQIEMRFARVGAESQWIGTVSSVPIFDAVIVENNDF
jgi:Tol biopolymer transport system component